MSVRVFPEVQDLFIDQLRPDKRALSKCCLVSFRWLIRARHWLFSSVEVLIANNSLPDPDPRQKEICAKLGVAQLTKLLLSPHCTFAPHLHNLRILGADPLFGTERASPVQYTELCAHIERIVPLLTQVQVLGIDTLTWSLLPARAKAILGSLRNVTAMHWTYTTCDNTFQLFSFISKSFPKLETISLQGLFLYDVDASLAKEVAHNKSLTTPLCRRLDKFVMTIDESMVTLPLLFVSEAPAIVNLRNLTYVDIGLESGDNTIHVDRFLKAIGPGLETLHLWFWEDSLPLSRPEGEKKLPLSLPENVDLKTMEIGTWRFPNDSWWLEDIFDTLASPLVLIKLYMKFQHWHRRRSIRAFDFAPLERSLLSGGSDRKRCLHIAVEPHSRPQFRRICETLEQAMSELNRRELLFILHSPPLPVLDIDPFDLYLPA